MERKKAKKVNLQKHRSIFLSLGVLLSLSFVLLAFEWNFDGEEARLESKFILYDFDAPPITLMEKKVEPPKPRTQIKMEIIDDSSTDDTPEIDFTTEIDPGDEITDPFDGDDLETYVDDTDFPLDPSKLEIQAEFPGGDKALLEFIRKNTIYPIDARDMGISGKVWIQFVIGRNGKVRDAVILQSPDRLLSKSALKTIKKLPDFKPAKQNGKSVSMYFRIPVNFKLQ